MKKRTIYIGLFLIFVIGLVSLIGTLATDSTITEGNSSKADYLFNITLGDRTNREIVIPSYDSKIVDIKISNPNTFNMSYLFYLEGTNSNISAINISDTDARGILPSTGTDLIKVFIQNNSGSDITTSIRDIVGFDTETLSLPSNSTSIDKGAYYKSIVKSNSNDYGKVKPNIKLSVINGTVKYTLVPNEGYQYKSTTCDGTVSNNILTISDITSNVNCEVVFEPVKIQVSLDLVGGEVSATYTEPQEHTYTIPYTGSYRLETWGAQGGGTTGGYGGYSTGTINVKENDILYINVGGQGTSKVGGYNGGGNASGGTTNIYGGAGGGATHIATSSGLLSTFENKKSDIIIVSGGGGGAAGWVGNHAVYSDGASAGGYIGNTGIVGTNSVSSGKYTQPSGGTQTSGGTAGVGTEATGNAGSFGQGGVSGTRTYGGGGGGYYGGGGGGNSYYISLSGAGGSSYIGSSKLSNKSMHCYDCTESSEEAIKTIATPCHSETLTENCTKEGNGAAKVTLVDDIVYNVDYNGKYGILPTPVKEGFVFGGWYTGEDGTGRKISSNTPLTEMSNHTLYAFWIKPTEYSSSGNYEYTVPRNGFYKIELWGAQGGSSLLDNGTRNITSANCLLDGKGKCFGGYGSYTSGIIQLYKDEILYLFVGGQGTSGIKSQDASGGYNGGGIGTWDNSDDEADGAGGGATDVRLVSGEWNDATSLASRIMVAAGGGGASDAVSGLAGGGLTNSNITITNYTVSKFTEVNQVSGYAFGIGQDGVIVRRNNPISGAGGGYYGGYALDNGKNFYNFGGGGSSYISGHTGCVAITSSSDTTPKSNCTTGTTDNSCSVHYSNRKFIDTVMIDGLGYSWTNEKGELEAMPNPEGGYYASGVGKSGDGTIKITFIGEDIEAPTGTMTTSKDYNTIIANITATDNYGVDHYEYYLSTSSTCPTTGYNTSYSNTYSFVVKNTGTYYVCARAVDGNNNILSLKSDAIVFSRVYSVTVRYNTNGGTITSSTGSNTWTTDSTGLIYRNGNVYEQIIYYGEPADLADYNNSNFININPGELFVPVDKEWICLSGCSTANKEFSQKTKYSTDDFCDITNANCTVVLGLKLVTDANPPTCSLSANASTISATASDDMGITYQGWNSSYSGDNETTKDIAKGTFTYYVKDIAGNTNTCTIDVKSTGSYQKTVTNETSASENWGTRYTGSCSCIAITIDNPNGTRVNGTCNYTSGCSCSGTNWINNCVGKSTFLGYYCTSGTLSGSKCITTGTQTVYTCDTGYTKIGNKWCYKAD